MGLLINTWSLSVLGSEALCRLCKTIVHPEITINVVSSFTPLCHPKLRCCKQGWNTKLEIFFPHKYFQNLDWIQILKEKISDQLNKGATNTVRSVSQIWLVENLFQRCDILAVSPQESFHRLYHFTFSIFHSECHSWGANPFYKYYCCCRHRM